MGEAKEIKYIHNNETTLWQLECLLMKGPRAKPNNVGKMRRMFVDPIQFLLMGIGAFFRDWQVWAFASFVIMFVVVFLVPKDFALIRLPNFTFTKEDLLPFGYGFAVLISLFTMPSRISSSFITDGQIEDAREKIFSKTRVLNQRACFIKYLERGEALAKSRIRMCFTIAAFIYAFIVIPPQFFNQKESLTDADMQLSVYAFMIYLCVIVVISAYGKAVNKLYALAWLTLETYPNETKNP